MYTIYVVGIGPGNYKQMTLEAIEVLERCDVIVGYTVYVDLIKPYFKGKKFLSTPMTKEIDRCHMAFEQASAGADVAIVCSGDAGVYGMSGLVLGLSDVFPNVKIQNIAGVSAVLSGASILGAPLIHDFAVISLSDLLTPWEKIEKRLRMAAEADFVISLYNPSSKKRADYLRIACEIIMESRDVHTPCGVCRNIGRLDESVEVMDLVTLKDYQADMFSTVFIGNSQTKIINGKLLTPRGYKNE